MLAFDPNDPGMFADLVPQANRAPAAPAAPQAPLRGPPRAPPEGYQPQAGGLAPIPGGPQDPRRPGGPLDPEAQMSPQAIDLQADRYLMTGELPPLGIGGAGGARQRILNRAAERAAAASHGAGDLATQTANYRALRTTLQNQQTQLANIQAQEQTASNNLDALAHVSHGLPGQTETPLVNSAVHMAQQNSGLVPGHAQVSAYKVAYDTAINEYARLISMGSSGNGQLTDAARAEAQRMIPYGSGPEALDAAIQQARVDMANRRSSYEQTVAHLQAQIAGRDRITASGSGVIGPAGMLSGHPTGPVPPGPGGGNVPPGGGSPAGGIANGIGAGQPVDHRGDAVVFGMDRTPPPPPPNAGPLPGGAEFAGALQAAIRTGQFHSVAEAMQFAHNLNPYLAQTVNQADLAAAIRNPRLAGVAVPHGTPPAPPPPPDISAQRGDQADPRQIAIQNAMRRSIYNNLGGGGPMIAGPSGIAEMVSGPEAGAAALRGSEDVASVGLAPRMNALSDTIGQGGTYQGNLDQQQAIDNFDTSNHPFARFGGEAVTGAPFAMLGGASLGRQMIANGAYGFAHGFNSGQGSAGDRLQNAGIEGTVGAASPAVLNMAGRLGGRMIAPLLGGAPANAERRAMIEAANRQGVDLMRADTGGVGTRMATGVVGRTFGGIPLADGARASAASAGQAVDRVAADMGTIADPAGAGQSMQRGLRSWLDTSRARGNQIRDNIPIPPGQPAQTSTAQAILSDRTAGMASNPMLSDMFKDPRLEGYLAALQGRATQVPTGVLDAQGNPIMRTVQQGGGLNWQDLRNFRSRIGEIIEQPSVAGDPTTKGALRSLYAGLSQDMQATAAQVSPRALTLVNRSIQYDRGRAARREGILTDILGSDFGNNAEQAFQRINSWAQQKGGNFAAVAQTLRSMPEEDANTVRASIFARMGDAAPARQDVAAALAAQQGAPSPTFSPAEFSRQWNLMDDRAKSFLIPDAGHRAALNDLALITAGQKRASEFQNFSNTALAGNALGFISGLATHPVLAISYALGSYGAGKFLASAPAARWLAQTARARTQQAVQAQIGRLSSIATRNPAIAQEVLTLRRMMLGGANDNFGTAAAASGTDSQPQYGNDQSGYAPRQ